MSRDSNAVYIHLYSSVAILVASPMFLQSISQNLADTVVVKETQSLTKVSGVDPVTSSHCARVVPPSPHKQIHKHVSVQCHSTVYTSRISTHTNTYMSTLKKRLFILKTKNITRNVKLNKQFTNHNNKYMTNKVVTFELIHSLVV